MADQDWKKVIDDAATVARKEADGATDDELKEIQGQAALLRGIFDDLELTDKATYDQLIKIVEEATRRNESIASVIDRLKAPGTAGTRLAATIGNISSGGALTVLRQTLNL